jgi:hypothetical protein
LTFTQACKHLANYTSGHETRWKCPGASRFDYPDRHIEADCRLAWFLGELDERYGDRAFYVHLLRDREAVARSFNRRWKLRDGILNVYARSIRASQPGTIEVARDYCDTVNANVRLFLKDKTLQMTLHLEQILLEFPAFLSAIGAQGNLSAALEEWRIPHHKTRHRTMRERLARYCRKRFKQLRQLRRSAARPS